MDGTARVNGTCQVSLETARTRIKLRGSMRSLRNVVGREKRDKAHKKVESQELTRFVSRAGKTLIDWQLMRAG